jgi:hypothetical protein
MNNWGGSNFMIAQGGAYQKFPGGETYPYLLVNYVKLDRVPAFDEDWSPILTLRLSTRPSQSVSGNARRAACT